MKRGMINAKHLSMHKMMGLKILIIGILVLANLYWFNFSWPLVIGWTLVILGIAKLIMHCCHKKR